MSKKRLCVFYRLAEDWLGKPVEWIVCKKCQAKLRKGEHLSPGYSCQGEANRTTEEQAKWIEDNCVGDGEGYCPVHGCVHYEY